MIERRNILIDYTFFFYFKHQQSYNTETINHIQILWEWMTKHDLNNAETTKFILFSLCLWSRVCLGELPEEFWKQPTGKYSVNLSHLTAYTQPFCPDWLWSTRSCVQAGLHWHRLPSAFLTVAPGKEARLTGSWPSARPPLCTNTIHNRKRDASWPRSACVWTDFYATMGTGVGIQKDSGTI